MLSLVAARNWQSCQVVSFMKNLFLEDELKYFFLRFYWDVRLFTLVKPIIMGGEWFLLRHDFNELIAVHFLVFTVYLKSSFSSV